MALTDRIVDLHNSPFSRNLSASSLSSPPSVSTSHASDNARVHAAYFSGSGGRGLQGMKPVSGWMSNSDKVTTCPLDFDSFRTESATRKSLYSDDRTYAMPNGEQKTKRTSWYAGRSIALDILVERLTRPPIAFYTGLYSRSPPFLYQNFFFTRK